MDNRPLITMSRFGTDYWGRFGNQIFQYAFLHLYTEKNNFRIQIAPWIGQYLFGHNDPPITEPLPYINDCANNPFICHVNDSPIAGNIEPPKNVDIMGFFQYHTSFYKSHKDFFRFLFKPVLEVEVIVKKSVDILRGRGKTVIGFHLRRGDHKILTTDIEEKETECFGAPCEWYLTWLEKNWSRFDEPVLFLASDELCRIENDFAKYYPITNKQLEIKLPIAPFYPDFYTLSHCDVLCISNSSFSFAASMLNEKCVEQYRPRLKLKKLISYDPWNAHTGFGYGNYNDPY